MSTTTDHAAEAEYCLGNLNGLLAITTDPGQSAMVWAMQAQAHATLALVEAMRPAPVAETTALVPCTPSTPCQTCLCLALGTATQGDDCDGWYEPYPLTDRISASVANLREDHREAIEEIRDRLTDRHAAAAGGDAERAYSDALRIVAEEASDPEMDR